MQRGIWLVTFVFSTSRFVTPTRTRVGDETSLEGFLRHHGGGLAAVTGPGASDGAAITNETAAHLRWQLLDDDDEIVSRYLFDAVYAAAHPEVMDDEHLAIVHGTVAAKMFDDDAMVLDRDGLVASLRWNPVERPGVRLTRRGKRR